MIPLAKVMHEVNHKCMKFVMIATLRGVYTLRSKKDNIHAEIL